MSASSPKKGHATLADLEALPDYVKGEIIDGELYTSPRPHAGHQNAEGGLFADILGPFQRGRGGPGGWLILSEPGIRVPRAAEFSPDVAGWRRTTLARLTDAGIPITTVPDWICEILSPSTRSYDMLVKRRFYAEIGVAHLWYVDLEDGAILVSRLVDGHWLEVGVFPNDKPARMEPFDAVELDPSLWWPPKE